MKVDDALVDHLAHLSRLHFEPAEKEAIRQDMEKIIGFVTFTATITGFPFIFSFVSITNVASVELAVLIDLSL